MDILLLIAGLILLIKGADFFVEGASSVAVKLRVPPLIIGLTVVSLGTSAPEAAISISASISGSNSISLGNVIGSNMFNILAVIGVTALVRPLEADRDAVRRDMPLAFIASGALAVVMLDGVIERYEAALFLLTLAVYLFAVIRSSMKATASPEERKSHTLRRSMLYIVGGAAAVVFGGDMTVSGAESIAAKLGMSETLIGLTVVAFGTSLPELVTSLSAARKGEPGIAVGNAVGSCLFNILFILGITGVLKPLDVGRELIFDGFILAAATLTVYIMVVRDRHFGRLEGAIAVMVYTAYTVFIILRAYGMI